MRNHKTPLVIIALCAAGAAAAGGQGNPAKTASADPIVGTWKLDTSQSKLASTNTAPKEEMQVCLAVNGRIECTIRTTRTDGSTSSFKVNWPGQGGMVQAQGDGVPSTYSGVETHLRTGEWLVTDMIEGRQVGTLRKLISKDGKTMRQTVQGVDTQGKSFEEVRVYEKQ